MSNLFSFRGAQDYIMIPNQQITSPEIILLPFNRQFSLTLIKCGDLLKIRGFIVNRNKIEINDINISGINGPVTNT